MSADARCNLFHRSGGRCARPARWRLPHGYGQAIRGSLYLDPYSCQPLGAEGIVEEYACDECRASGDRSMARLGRPPIPWETDVREAVRP